MDYLFNFQELTTLEVFVFTKFVVDYFSFDLLVSHQSGIQQKKKNQINCMFCG